MLIPKSIPGAHLYSCPPDSQNQRIHQIILPTHLLALIPMNFIKVDVSLRLGSRLVRHHHFFDSSRGIPLSLDAIVRSSFPVIFGRAMNFTLPSTAKGPTIEAEMNGTLIVFPLRPTPTLSWVNCQVQVEKKQAKDYRRELKAGYRFR
jgi:hypothetical protein